MTTLKKKKNLRTPLGLGLARDGVGKLSHDN